MWSSVRSSVRTHGTRAARVTLFGLCLLFLLLLLLRALAVAPLLVSILLVLFEDHLDLGDRLSERVCMLVEGM